MDRSSADFNNSSCIEEFTMNLISNASMETFPGNTLSSFTTLLPTPIQLSGEWQVALVEIAWPNVVQNVTVGEFTVCKIRNHSPVEKRPLKHNRPGAISMVIPEAFQARSSKTSLYSAPVRHRLKPGCYTSVDTILEAMSNIATGKKSKSGNESKATSPAHDSPMLSWKTDKVTRLLQVKFRGNLQEDGMKISIQSNDLQNILGTNVIIDCDGSQKEIVGDKNATETVVKQVGKFPVDLNGGSHTMFLYCDLVQNQTLGDKQTALLRSIPLKSVTLAHALGEMNHKSFNNLQWKRVIKPQFQSISITLANEMGQRMPFLSCGRTNVTLAFRPTPRR